MYAGRLTRIDVLWTAKGHRYSTDHHRALRVGRAEAEPAVILGDVRRGRFPGDQHLRHRGEIKLPCIPLVRDRMLSACTPERRPSQPPKEHRAAPAHPAATPQRPRARAPLRAAHGGGGGLSEEPAPRTEALERGGSRRAIGCERVIQMQGGARARALHPLIPKPADQRRGPPRQDHRGKRQATWSGPSWPAPTSAGAVIIDIPGSDRSTTRPRGSLLKTASALRCRRARGPHRGPGRRSIGREHGRFEMRIVVRSTLQDGIAFATQARRDLRLLRGDCDGTGTATNPRSVFRAAAYGLNGPQPLHEAGDMAASPASHELGEFPSRRSPRKGRDRRGRRRAPVTPRSHRAPQAYARVDPVSA
jgi:hypothetical protein